MHDPTPTALWENFHAAADPALRLRLRAQLVEHYLPLVGFTLKHVHGGGRLTRGDLFQEGVLGLCSAVDRFNPELGSGFAAFAIPRIRGAMLDALREWAWGHRRGGEMERCDTLVLAEQRQRDDRNLQRVDDRDEVEHLLRRTTLRQRSVIRGRFLRAASVAQMAKELGCSNANISCVMASGLAAIREDGR